MKPYFHLLKTFLTKYSLCPRICEGHRASSKNNVLKTSLQPMPRGSVEVEVLWLWIALETHQIQSNTRFCSLLAREHGFKRVIVETDCHKSQETGESRPCAL
jgi:hypothetical protein